MRNLPFLRPARIGPPLLLFAFIVLTAKDWVRAQDKKAPDMPAPRLLTISPAGGQLGTSFEITLAGQNLDEPQDLLLSIPGAKASYLAPTAAPMIDPKAKQPRGMVAPGPLTAAKFKVT